MKKRRYGFDLTTGLIYVIVKLLILWESRSLTFYKEGEMNKLLPMEEYAQEFIRTLAQFRVVIVVGETGCGKTTKIPQILLSAVYAEKGIIACTEPRRIAAIAAARRVSTERGEEVGATIGYHVRFEEAQSKGTKVLFMTDGVLMQEVRSDPLLRRYSVIMVDEAHERNLYTDFTLAYLKSLVKRRSDLKVVIASATIDPVKFMGYFGTLGLVKVPGRVYPVEIEYRQSDGKMIEAAAWTVHEIHTKREGGDILVFLPGIGEIRALRSVLLKMKLRGIEMLFLYGGMEPSEQERVFERFPGRKVILATNVAETSITIPGVRYVVDTGHVRFPGYNPNQGVETLYLEQISQASATQRAGRAGRTQNGICFRLMSKAEYEKLPSQTEPEISRSDLTGLVLTARRYGIENVANLDFLTRPSGELVDSAVATLTDWGALDSAGRITPYGEQLAKISVEPALARFMTLAAEEGCLKEAATIAAFLSVHNLFFKEGGFGGFGDIVPQAFRDPMGDLFSYLRVWFSYQASLIHPTTWCQKHHLNPRVILGVCRIRSQIIQEARRAGLAINSSISRDAIGMAIVRAFSHNLCLYEGNGQYCSGRRSGIKIAKSSVLSERKPERFVAVSFLKVGNLWTKSLWAVGNVEVQPEWIDLLPKQKEAEPKIVGKLPFPIYGMVQITDHYKRRLVQVRFNPTEDKATAVKTITQGCLALDLSKIPFPELKEVWAVPREKVPSLTPEERYAPFPIIFEEDEKLREQITKGAGIEDRLLERFLVQPFQALELSGGVVMKLLAGGLTTVRDITECSEQQLSGGYGKRMKFRFKDLPKFDDDEIEEIKERLAHYSLQLKESWEMRTSAFLPEGEMRVMPNRVDSDKAKEVLGEEDFADFLAMHSLSDSNSKIAVRNRLCTRHVKLAWKIGIAYEWVIPV